VIEVIEAADATEHLRDLPGLLLPALAAAFGADSAGWTELPGMAGPPSYHGYPEPLLDATTSLTFEQYVPVFPLATHTRPGGDGRPLRRSDLQTRRNYRASGVYADVLRPLGVEEILAMSLPHRQVHVCLSLHRTGSDFRPEAVELLTALRPLLVRRLARLTEPDDPRRPTDQAVLTNRQHEILCLVSQGLTDAAIAHRLRCSPRTVDKHLEHIYRRLGVSCRTAAVAGWLGLGHEYDDD
jgi:DNA-binding CsgD family transcriptional regulator